MDKHKLSDSKKIVEGKIVNNLIEKLEDAEIFYPGDIEKSPYDYLLSFRGK